MSRGRLIGNIFGRNHGERAVIVRKLLGAVLTVPVLIGGLLLVSAAPAAACSCVAGVSDAEQAANADAVFVGKLVDRREPPQRPVMSSSDPAVLTFQVSRVYKGMVGERQEIVTAQSGASCGLELVGEGPFLVFGQLDSGGFGHAVDPGQYAANLCGGSRAIADGGEPGLGTLSAPQPPGGPSGSEPVPPVDGPGGSPSTASIALGVLLMAALAGAGLAVYRIGRASA